MAKVPSEKQLKALAGDVNSKATIKIAESKPDSVPEGEYVAVPGSGLITSDDISVKTITPEKTTFQDYSTEEQIIGEWIDGKAIYRRVFTGSFRKEQNVSHTEAIASGIGKVLRAFGTVTYGNKSGTFVIPYSQGNTGAAVFFSNSGVANLYMTDHHESGTEDYQIVLEYTKP